ncbi:MAG TPA: LLM class flavin-dependent oxidoreductase [Candidatus Limnocylindrales bacterium]|nr:LLM class flavin-dependent oxidoreductase [Candidatus Limnocylindrales bacterium]
MRVGIILNVGEPRTLADLAAEAEAAGWDGVFSYDAIAIGPDEMYDPWVVLAAMAMRTERVRLGLVVAAPARRRPWKLARETMTLDRLSNGRLILPVGLGALDDAGFGNVGEPTGSRVRAERLDETLAILDGLWSGEPFGFEGRHYRFEPMTFRPTPVQRPRIPIWVVGAWPHERSIRRALRWDGILLQVGEPEAASDEARAAVVRRLREDHRLAELDRPFEIVLDGTSPADPGEAAERLARYGEAGVTWWIEADWSNSSVDALRRRIAAGPPRPAASRVGAA